MRTSRSKREDLPEKPRQAPHHLISKVGRVATASPSDVNEKVSINVMDGDANRSSLSPDSCVKRSATSR